LQRREAELTDATAEVAAGRDRLLQLGMSQEAVDILRRTRVMNSTARVVASMAGTVMHRRAAVGQVVQSADTIYEIADLSRLWLVADVPEYQGSTLRPGQTVEAKIEALGNRVIRGQLSFVNAIVNPETRTVLARMNLRNPDGTLKPSMLASMTIQDRAQKHLAVPSEAVVRDETGEYVFLEKGSGTFLLHPVKLGPEMDGKRVIEGGVKEGTRIVTGGSFHLNNERRRRNVRGGEGG
jgi:cobalt-zinc-cadmium efflux system membrane fusion protein